MRRSKVLGTLNRLSCPLALTGKMRRGFFRTQDKLCGNHPYPARLFGSLFAYGLQTRLDLRIRRGAQNQVGYVRDDALKGVPG